MTIKITNDILHLNINDCLDLNAIQNIQTFCNKNIVEVENLGHGYSILKINGKNYDITPFGIDVDMMLKFCELN